mgnify:CR=1 FL=1
MYFQIWIVVIDKLAENVRSCVVSLFLEKVNVALCEPIDTTVLLFILLHFSLMFTLFINLILFFDHMGLKIHLDPAFDLNLFGHSSKYIFSLCLLLHWYQMEAVLSGEFINLHPVYSVHFITFHLRVVLIVLLMLLNLYFQLL